MQLELPLTVQQEALLQKAAAEAGLTPGEYLAWLIRFHLAEERLQPLRARIKEKLHAAGITKEEDFYDA